MVKDVYDMDDICKFPIEESDLYLYVEFPQEPALEEQIPRRNRMDERRREVKYCYSDLGSFA